MSNQFSDEGFIPKHGGYKNLLSYQKAYIIMLGTPRFCEKFMKHSGRTYDQMVQAARSGEKNILEGSVDSGVSKRSEIYLTGIARGSLLELKGDFETFLINRSLSIWGKDHPYYTELEKKHHIRPQTYEIFKKGIESDDPEVAANVLLSLIKVTAYLLTQQLKRMEQDFIEKGGVTERMTRARVNYRSKEETRKGELKEVTDDTFSLDLVKRMVEWDRERNILEDWKWNTLRRIAEGVYPLSGKYIYACKQNLKTLKDAGFEE